MLPKQSRYFGSFVGNAHGSAGHVVLGCRGIGGVDDARRVAVVVEAVADLGLLAYDNRGR